MSKTARIEVTAHGEPGRISGKVSSSDKELAIACASQLFNSCAVAWMSGPELNSGKLWVIFIKGDKEYGRLVRDPDLEPGFAR